MCIIYTTSIFVHIPDSVYFLCAHNSHTTYLSSRTQRHNSCQVSDIENSLHNYLTIAHIIGDEGYQLRSPSNVVWQIQEMSLFLV